MERVNVEMITLYQKKCWVPCGIIKQKNLFTQYIIKEGNSVPESLIED